MELKQSLRMQAKALRTGMSPEEMESQSAQICKMLTASPLFTEADCLLTYLSMPTEPDTHQLIAHAFGLGIPVAAPVILNKRIKFTYFEDFSQLTSGLMGILQPTGQAQPLPTANSLCVVPGLWYDRRGYRVGYGGGYFDRFLPGFPGRTVGFCFSEFLVDELPHDPWDYPVEWITLPGQMIKID